MAKVYAIRAHGPLGTKDLPEFEDSPRQEEEIFKANPQQSFNPKICLGIPGFGVYSDQSETQAQKHNHYTLKS